MWHHLHAHCSPPLDTSGHTVRPSICGIRHLCSLPRRSIAGVTGFWNRQNTIASQSLCPWIVAGSLSFGGAYTAIPFVHVEAVLKGAWLPRRVFIDCTAIGNVLPAPHVIFATFVGFQGGKIEGGLGTAFAGAIVITLGVFFPLVVPGMELRI